MFIIKIKANNPDLITLVKNKTQINISKSANGINHFRANDKYFFNDSSIKFS